MLYNIMGNDFVGEEYKARLRKSAKLGRDGGKMKRTSKKSCVTEFPCLQLDRSNNNLIPKSTSKIAPKQLKQNLRRNYRVKSVKKD